MALNQTALAFETVTVPARLLLRLYWSAEALLEARDGDDKYIPDELAAAEEALRRQAPRNHELLEMLDHRRT